MKCNRIVDQVGFCDKYDDLYVLKQAMFYLRDMVTFYLNV